MTKREIREQIRQQKRQYSEEQLRQLSQPVIEALLSHPRVIKAQTILLYHSLPDEVDTHDAIRMLLSKGKRIFLPVITGDDRMTIREYLGESNLQKGAFNIMEPTRQDGAETEPFNCDLAVIPGVAFDRKGNRLGRGKGYYDRFLSTHPSVYTIGICFPFQLAERIPTEENDMPVQEVITT